MKPGVLVLGRELLQLTEREKHALDTIAHLGDISMSSRIRNAWKGLGIQTSTVNRLHRMGLICGKVTDDGRAVWELTDVGRSLQPMSGEHGCYFTVDEEKTDDGET